MNNKLFTMLIAGTLYGLTAIAQLTQNIRGTVIDQLLQTPIAGATIIITGTNKKVVADSSGNFRFINMAAGTYTLVISHINYNNAAASNIIVNTGKEVVLTIGMETRVRTEKAVEVTATSKKNKPLNDMSVVSARAFTVEETQRYAAAVNDPLRMVTGFAGVASADDGGNEIVIRGNAPTGLLWRMEGVDIPNPNHFSEAGSSGGGISILSSQLLANSDFLTGAFAAEYGNALSGVFDLKLRKGNNEKK
ncbi:MAG TPA: TonB-dependent receptor, partial [Niastella sp.]|nr:TonB-dependent receptor [Niastella sp.]